VRPGARTPPRQRRRRVSPLAGHPLIETIVTVIIALAVAFGIRTFIIAPYRIPSQSMETTLKVGQHVLASKITTRFSNPKIGDIVVFHPPVSATQVDSPETACADAAGGEGKAKPCDQVSTDRSGVTFIKRVVGLPGDTIAIRNGLVIRNGTPLKLPGTGVACGDADVCTFDQSIVVPKGSYFMMGDNRRDSYDSRYWGPVPKSWIIGGAFFTYWPLSRIGPL
jgi:signal peptidase I